MSSFRKHHKSSTKVAIVLMSSNVQLAGAKDVMADMCIGSLTRAVQTWPAISSAMQKFVGAPRQ